MTRFVLSRRRFLGTASALGGLVLLHPFSARAQAGQAHLRIMETTDLHCHVFPYDYYADEPNDTMGLARTAAHHRGDPRRGDQFDARRQRRLPAGQPDGRLHRLRARHKDGDVHPVIAA